MRILKIKSLPSAKEWVDRDAIMLHTCFQILEDCVEKEEVDKHCNYENHKKEVDEVRFLYNWWNKRKLHYQYNIEFKKQDDEMLLRLMKIRTFLWT